MQAYVEKLTTSSEYLRRTAHKEWEDFLVAVDMFTSQQIVNMVNADASVLQQSQGRVQAVSELQVILREAPKIMEKLEAAKSKSKV
jgi:hypothetical protein